MAGSGQQFVCAVCGYVFEGETPPGECPLCKAGAAYFLAFHADDIEAEFD